MSTDISFIIPAYNKPKLLRTSIKSALSQRYVTSEVIVIDDCSQPSLAKMIKADFPKVIYLRNMNNRGPSYSRNRGLKHAKGKYVCFLDADDQLLPTFAHQMISHLGHNQVIVCASSPVFEDSLPRSSKILLWGINFLRNLVLSFYYYFNQQRLPLVGFFGVSPSRVVMTRKLALRNLFNEQMRQSEDWELMIRIMKKHAVTINPAALVKFYFSNSSQTHVMRQQQGVRAYLEVLNHIPKPLHNHPLIVGFRYYTQLLSHS